MTVGRVAAILDQLDASGLRRTGARSRVVRAALARKRPFTAQELADRLAPEGIGRATVFRALDLLSRIGALSRIHGIDRGDRCVRYRPCAPTHHHHLACRACGRVEEIFARDLEPRLARVAAARGYRALAHTVEIEGLCPRCRG